ncbi:MAG TPA: GNAT family protein [Xanthobacteraceae bacterium]|nr:GNAT family protein [Xanthobacteraceae bacterium]
MPWPEPVELHGAHASLVQLSRDHLADLDEAVRDGELWRLWYTFVPTREKLAEFVDKRLADQAEGKLTAFAVIDVASGRAVGTTNYLNVEPEHRRVEIGGTWYRRSVQRTPINTECKLMLLRHAFEQLNCIAVEFRTHFFNHASRRGIERLGAKLDGILRNHQIAPNGSLRDTVVYSIIANEWPAVKAHLTFQMEKPRNNA